jgi:hypothetical protein
MCTLLGLLLLRPSALWPFPRCPGATRVTWWHLACCCCSHTAAACWTAVLPQPLALAGLLAAVWLQVAALGGWQGAVLAITHSHNSGDGGQSCSLTAARCIPALLLWHGRLCPGPLIACWRGGC